MVAWSWGGRGLGAAMVGLLAPPRCLGCRALDCHGLELGLCAGCRLQLARGALPGPPLDGIRRTLAATSYAGPAIPLVAALKSGATPLAAATMAELLAESLGRTAPELVLVPVGAARGRLLRRGLDPAHELALALSPRLELPVAAVLARRDHRRQRGRPRELRLADPPRFKAIAPAPDQVLLVDDVLTTGGTLRACAAALSEAGSRGVSALVFARTPLGR